MRYTFGMELIDAVRYMIKESGTSARSLSRELGKSPTYMAATFANDSDIGARNLAKMADAMGWRLVLEKDGAQVPIDPRPSGE